MVLFKERILACVEQCNNEEKLKKTPELNFSLDQITRQRNLQVIYIVQLHRSAHHKIHTSNTKMKLFKCF